jgi:hypothetical protein
MIYCASISYCIFVQGASGSGTRRPSSDISTSSTVTQSSDRAHQDHKQIEAEKSQKSSPCEGLVPATNVPSMVNGGSQLAVDVSGRRISSAGSPLAPGSPHLPPGKAEGPHSPASAEYWLSRNPLADHIFITDVTVNLMTVTIRECKTQDGFFKNRPMDGAVSGETEDKN